MSDVGGFLEVRAFFARGYQSGAKEAREFFESQPDYAYSTIRKMRDALRDSREDPHRHETDQAYRNGREEAYTDALNIFDAAQSAARKDAIEREKHNGWTNYATWRVNLELCDDTIESYAQDIEGGHLEPFESVSALADCLQDDVDNAITGYGEREEGIAVDYARAFVNDVNWYEIAEHGVERGLIASDDDETDDDEDDTP